MKTKNSEEAKVNDFYERFEFKKFDISCRIKNFIERTTLSDLRNMKCLDVGFGHGIDIIVMEKLGGEVYGIDISPKNVRNAIKKTGNRKLRQGSVLDLPFKDNTFDFVYCSGVIHHTTNPERAVSELVRVTKQGKLIFLFVYRKGFQGNLISLLRRINIIPYRLFNPLWRDLLYVPILKRFTPDEINGMFSRHKIIIIRRTQKKSILSKGTIQVLGRKQ